MKINIKIWQVPVFIFTAIFLLLISFNFTQACGSPGTACTQSSDCCSGSTCTDLIDPATMQFGCSAVVTTTTINPYPCGGKAVNAA
jgi:hypothetical protein